MRLCIVVEGNATIPPQKGGGVEEVVRILAKGLLRRRHEVSIVCGKVGDRSKLEGVKFCQLKTFRFLGTKINKVLYSLKAPLFLLRNRRKFDLICFHACQLNYPVVAYVSKFLSGKPVVYSTHMACPWDLDYEEIPFIDRLNVKLRGFCKRRVDRVITPSIKIKQNIIKYTGLKPNKIRAIYLPIDTELFSPKYGRGARHRLGLSDYDLMILFAGRLIDIKGVEYLLRAVPIVKKEVDNAKFVLVGGERTGVDTIPRRWLALCNELGIEDDVIFTGVISHEMLAKIYPSADIFVLPTTMESFGLVVFEAMASGLPVISTDCADIPQLISECGIVVKKKDEVDLANAIIRLAKDKNLRERYSKKAIEVVKERLSIERLISEYEQVYAECLENE